MMLGKNRMTNEEKREDAQRFVRWAAAAAAIVAGGGIPDDCAKCGQRRSADDLDVQGRCLEDLHCPTWDVGRQLWLLDYCSTCGRPGGRRRPGRHRPPLPRLLLEGRGPHPALQPLQRFLSRLRIRRLRRRGNHTRPSRHI